MKKNQTFNNEFQKSCKAPPKYYQYRRRSNTIISKLVYSKRREYGNLAYYLFQLLVEDSYNGNIIDNYDSITEEAKETIDMQTKAGFVKPESN